MGAPTKLTPQILEQIRTLHAAGASSREIGEAIGVAQATAARFLRSDGLEPNGGHGARATRNRPLNEPTPAEDLEGILSKSGAVVDFLASSGATSLETAQKRLAQWSAAVDAMFPKMLAGTVTAAALATLQQQEAKLALLVHQLTPPDAVDPERDPTNVEASGKVAAKLAQLVADAEARARCVHCGRFPWGATHGGMPGGPA